MVTLNVVWAFTTHSCKNILFLKIAFITFSPTIHRNLTFYDYYGTGLDKRDAAVQFHPWNRFGQTATYSSFEDMKFENCARKIYFGEAGQDDALYTFGTRTPGELCLKSYAKTKLSLISNCTLELISLNFIHFLWIIRFIFLSYALRHYHGLCNNNNLRKIHDIVPQLTSDNLCIVWVI